MQSLTLTATAATHQTYAVLLKLAGRARSSRTAEGDIGAGAGAAIDRRDSGAVSLEQVLWFAAAGISVAVIAGILWAQIRDKADDPVVDPQAP